MPRLSPIGDSRQRSAPRSFNPGDCRSDELDYCDLVTLPDRVHQIHAAYDVGNNGAIAVQPCIVHQVDEPLRVAHIASAC